MALDRWKLEVCVDSVVSAAGRLDAACRVAKIPFLGREIFVQTIKLPITSLSNTSYVFYYDGVAVIVDAPRDLTDILAVFTDLDASTIVVLETHVHNDYLTGGPNLAAQFGSLPVVPAGAGVAYPHVPAFHNEALSFENGLEIVPLHTPGHTPEHVSYLTRVEGRPINLFSGGSLLLGGVGRTDLLGDERAIQLAHAQWHSVRRIGRLPEFVELLPTHGLGSFCSSGEEEPADGATIGDQLSQNSVFVYSSPDEYAEAVLPKLPPYPAYYDHMGALNLLGPLPYHVEGPALLSQGEVSEVLARSVAIIDIRPREMAAERHISGSLAIEMSKNMATWAGWLLPFDSEFVLVAQNSRVARRAARELAQIGFERCVGFIDSAALDAFEGPTSSFGVLQEKSVVEILGKRAVQIIDVRSPVEYARQRIEGSVNSYLPDLVKKQLDDLDETKPVWVVCESGYRASIAASILTYRGLDTHALVRSGVGRVLSIQD